MKWLPRDQVPTKRAGNDGINHSYCGSQDTSTVCAYSRIINIAITKSIPGKQTLERHVRPPGILNQRSKATHWIKFQPASPDGLWLCISHAGTDLQSPVEEGTTEGKCKPMNFQKGQKFNLPETYRRIRAPGLHCIFRNSLPFVVPQADSNEMYGWDASPRSSSRLLRDGG